MKFLAYAFLGAMLVGCNSSANMENATHEQPTTKPPANTADVTPSNSGSEGVAPMGSGAAGAATPMAGTDSVQGSGSGGMGGIGQAAKGQARRAAEQAGGRSMDQGAPAEDRNEQPIADGD